MVNKSTTVNRFVIHTLQRNITHLAVITRKTNIKLGSLKGGDWKRAKNYSKKIAGGGKRKNSPNFEGRARTEKSAIFGQNIPKTASKCLFWPVF